MRERDVPVPLALRPGLHLDRLRAVHARDRARRGEPRRPLVVGVERAEGVRHPLLDRERRARARAARAARRQARMPRRRGPRHAARRPRSPAPRRRRCSRWCRTRSGAAGSPTSSPRSTTARSTGDDADALAELLELGLATGRVRAVYGPEGEQAALALFRRLPLGRELTEIDPRAERGARRRSRARRSRRVAVNAVGPGEYGVTHLDRRTTRSCSALGRAGARGSRPSERET